MPRKIAPLLPTTDGLLRHLGERLRLARLRRRLAAKQLAERAGMAPMTLRSVERGGPGVTIGAYLAVMQVLGIEKDLDLLAQSDPMGRSLQDARLSAPHRKSTERKQAPPHLRTRAVGDAPSQSDPRAQRQGEQRLLAPADAAEAVSKPAADAREWFEKSGFASSQALANLIEAAEHPSRAKRR